MNKAPRNSAGANGGVWKGVLSWAPGNGPDGARYARSVPRPEYGVMTLTRTPSVLHGREAGLGDDADHYGCEAALNVAYLALTLWVSVLFFQKRVTFPAMYKVLVMAVLVTPFADWLLVSVGLAQSGRMSFDAAIRAAPKPMSGGECLANGELAVLHAHAAISPSSWSSSSSPSR